MKVLILEKDKAHLKYLSEYLQQVGLEVIEVNNIRDLPNDKAVWDTVDWTIVEPNMGQVDDLHESLHSVARNGSTSGVVALFASGYPGGKPIVIHCADASGEDIHLAHNFYPSSQVFLKGQPIEGILSELGI